MGVFVRPRSVAQALLGGCPPPPIERYLVERCLECGSWEAECGSPSPVSGCGCARCLAATVDKLRHLIKLMISADALAAYEDSLGGRAELRKLIRECLPR